MNQSVIAEWTAADSLSGIDSAVGTVASGQPIDTGSVGEKTFTVNAIDLAGNQTVKTVTYRVKYDFSGFFQPVDMGDNVVNTVKAGSAIPIKFSLDGDQGLNIFESGYPKVVGATFGTNTVLDQIETIITTAGNSSLSYDPIADQYIYVWKTDKSWAGLGKQLIVKLNDGMEYRANFLFRK